MVNTWNKDIMKSNFYYLLFYLLFIILFIYLFQKPTAGADVERADFFLTNIGRWRRRSAV